MSNRERAAEVMAAAFHAAEVGGPLYTDAENPREAVLDATYDLHLVARALEDEGLLAPDLPAPSRNMFPGGRVWYIEGPVGDVRATITGTVMAFGTWQGQPFRIVSTPEEMRTLARTLEAAAAHAGETLGDTDD